MKQDFLKRLGRLEVVAGPVPVPPEIWICEDGTCRSYMTGEIITMRELRARPCVGIYPRIIFMRDDEPGEDTL